MDSAERIERRVDRPQADQLDARPDVRVARLAGETWGVVGIAELRACGLSDDAVLTRVRGARLHPLHRGVYAVGHANPPREGRFVAAVKACGVAAVLSHHSAAAHWGFLDWVQRHPEVTVRGTGSRVHAGIRVHRTRTLESRDVTRHRGIPITTPARTLVDVAATLDHRALRRAVREAQSLRLAHIRQVVELQDRLGRRRGSRALARVLATGPAPTRSELEDVVLDLLLRGGIAHPDVSCPLFLDGRRLIPDFRWPDHRLIVEADGAAWHEGRLARADDAERQALLEANGERVIRVSWAQAVTHRAPTLARIVAAGAPADSVRSADARDPEGNGEGVLRVW